MRLSHFLDEKKDDKTESSCVVSFSNYSWFEKNKERQVKKLICQESDFDISFKLSSSAFATARNVTSEYHFDKNGVKLTYDQCCQLFQDDQFSIQFLNNIQKYYDRDLELMSGGSSQVVNEEDSQPLPDDYDDDVTVDDYVEPAPPPKRSLIQNSVVKRCKKL